MCKGRLIVACFLEPENIMDSRLAGCIREMKDRIEMRQNGTIMDADGVIDMIEGDEPFSQLIVAVELDEFGINEDVDRFIRTLRWLEDEKPLDGVVCGIIVDSKGELYTKDEGRRIAFALSRAGGILPGKPFVEATGNLRNFDIMAQNLKVRSNLEAYKRCCSDLIMKVRDFNVEDYRINMPRILAVHASSRKTSNSLELWSKVRSNLEGKAEIEEIQIRNGEIWDCRGCRFEQCLHHGEKGTCFYGGHMVEKVYPAVLKCDVIVFICPNYNDSVSADIMAVINRLTALFRTNDFSRKRVYAIVVSGYSGGDLVAKQILGAINLNKNFMLPGGFALLATANTPGSINEVPDIDEKAYAFAKRILLES